MSDLEQQFYADRALRNAALTVLKADFEHAKTSFSGKGLADRLTGRIGEGAKDVIEAAREKTDDNLGIIALLVSAIVLWFSREPIADFLGLGADDDEGENQHARTYTDAHTRYSGEEHD